MSGLYAATLMASALWLPLTALYVSAPSTPVTIPNAFTERA